MSKYRKLKFLQVNLLQLIFAVNSEWKLTFRKEISWKFILDHFSSQGFISQNTRRVFCPARGKRNVFFTPVFYPWVFPIGFGAMVTHLGNGKGLSKLLKSQIGFWVRNVLGGFEKRISADILYFQCQTSRYFLLVASFTQFCEKPVEKKQPNFLCCCIIFSKILLSYC